LTDSPRATAAETAVGRIRAALAARAAQLAERDPPYKEAAVALVLRATANGDDLELLLIKRAVRDGDPWSGQVALPGGRFDATDTSLEETALRETREEVGLDIRARGEVIGQLDELRPRTPVLPPIIVRPFVCVVRDAGELLPNHEVATMHWVPLATLFAKATRVHTSVHVRDIRMRVDAYQIGELTVWGMTERILSTFEEIHR
jgi:8-oxo-dGTP pyrophosphatase MutT (NUDIX family)